MLLPLLLDTPRSNQPFVSLQSTAAQSSFSLLRALCNRGSVHTILCSVLYDPSSLLETNSSTIEIHDWTLEVPGYSISGDRKACLLSAIHNAPKDLPMAVVVDSLEALTENLPSPIEAYQLMEQILDSVRNHSGPCQLIVHTVKPNEISELLLQISFSSSLIHLISHPTSLFCRLAKEYMVSPPPVSPGIKFWAVFTPLSERLLEVEKLSFGASGEGSGCNKELVFEIISRGINSQSRKRGTERSLEGWDSSRELPCPISDLQDLKVLYSQRQFVEAAPDPTQNLTFNLTLSESQQQSRAQVPLPYANIHEGQCANTSSTNSGAIFYDPDSADDIDDDDPDEDLDI